MIRPPYDPLKPDLPTRPRDWDSLFNYEDSEELCATYHIHALSEGLKCKRCKTAPFVPCFALDGLRFRTETSEVAKAVNSFRKEPDQLGAYAYAGRIILKR